MQSPLYEDFGVELMNGPVVITCEDAGNLAVQAADWIIEMARNAIRDRGTFTLVLAGGATPEKTYAALVRPERAAAIDWSKTYLFLGDERFVPLDDPRSNFGLARRSLLDHVPAPASHVFPITTHLESPAVSAAAYADDLARFFSRAASTFPPPRFDLVLLGLGEDGHTASLFPHAPSLQVEDAWVTWSRPGTTPPPVDRVTLTYPVLNAAHRVAFLVAGENKAAPVRDVLEGRADRDLRPAARVRPTDGTLTWFLDRGAASLLTPGPPEETS
jgi:6-phosphogluconolactonase